MGREWVSKAKCVRIPLSKLPDFFFPNNKQLSKIKAAKAFCQGCLVRLDCMKYAIENELEGIWGGMTDEERNLAKHLVPKSSSSGVLLDIEWNSPQPLIRIEVYIRKPTPELPYGESIQPFVIDLNMPGEWHTQHHEEAEPVQAEPSWTPLPFKLPVGEKMND